MYSMCLNSSNKFDSKKFVLLNVAIGEKAKLAGHSSFAGSNFSKGVNFNYISKISQSIPRQNDIIKIDIEGQKYSYKETFFDFINLNKPILILGLHKDFIIKKSENQIYQNLYT